METKNVNLSAITLVRKLALTTLIILSTLIAANADSTLPASKEKGIAVTALGVSDGSMMFNIQFDNASGDKISIVLADEQGTRLYREILSDKNIRKTFKMPADIGTVVLIVKNSNDRSEKKFRISTEQRMVEEVTVANVQ